ncbi:hypothetical protein MRB53_042320 [Persea americana]|nr:hypothetical protein MRB53_042320 [Persea americana]
MQILVFLLILIYVRNQKAVAITCKDGIDTLYHDRPTKFWAPIITEDDDEPGRKKIPMLDVYESTDAACWAVAIASAERSPTVHRDDRILAEQVISTCVCPHGRNGFSYECRSRTESSRVDGRPRHVMECPPTHGPVDQV